MNCTMYKDYKELYGTLHMPLVLMAISKTWWILHKKFIKCSRIPIRKSEAMKGEA